MKMRKGLRHVGYRAFSEFHPRAAQERYDDDGGGGGGGGRGGMGILRLYTA